MKLLQIAASGLQLQTQLKPKFKVVSLIKVSVIMWSFIIIILSEIPFVYVHETQNAAGCIYLRFTFWGALQLGA